MQICAVRSQLAVAEFGEFDYICSSILSTYMALNQLKLALWMMSELVNAKSAGISREELSDRWERSSINDRSDKAKGIPERTFYRLRNDLQDLFGVNIVSCGHGECRYMVENPEYSEFLGMFCRMVCENSGHSPSLHDLKMLVGHGRDITPEERHIIGELAFKLNRLAYETLRDLIAEANSGKIAGADRAQWADIKYHICVWLEATYQRTDSWVGVGIERNGEDGYGIVRFYIVNETDCEETHERLMRELDLLPPEQLDGNFRWFAPRDESLREVRYSSQPDMAKIRSVVEKLCARLNTI